MTETVEEQDAPTIPDLDTMALRVACFRIAKAMAWQRGPVSVQQIEALAQEIDPIIRHHADFLAHVHCDPNIAVRAADYLCHHHVELAVIDLERLNIQLRVLIELARPCTETIDQNFAFYDDLVRGIQYARDNVLLDTTHLDDEDKAP